MKKILIVIAAIIVVIIAIRIITSTAENSARNNPPNSAENAPEGSIHNLPVPAGVSAARAALATRLNISATEILILEAQETEWPDACLGIADPDTLCAQVITPGYDVRMQAVGKEYRYRTNTDGTVVKASN
jgi:hypothetical protein